MVLVAVSLLIKARPKMKFVNHFAICIASEFCTIPCFALRDFWNNLNLHLIWTKQNRSKIILINVAIQTLEHTLMFNKHINCEVWTPKTCITYS